jgi:2-C-methyl-D-erythritol 2,4-cyclodiphosphate synthase
MSYRIGTGYDVHRFASGRPLVLGGVLIPFERGLEGHSDADVLTHAVADALLGALADGDIGRHFPPGDPAWKDVSSLLLLEKVMDRLRARGGRVVNIDATLILEAPRIAPHEAAMRQTLGHVLGIPSGAVSIKATTNEGLGALGKGEGAAAMAVALVRLEEES